jgi:hypothetical protein
VIVGGIADQDMAGAVRSSLDAVFDDLRSLTLVILIATAIVAVAAYLWGRPAWAVSVASSAGDAARQAGTTVGSTAATAATAASAGSSRADLGDTILANRATIEKAGFAIIAFAVVGLAVGIEIALLGAALIVGLELAINALASKDSDDADPEPDEPPPGL